LNRASAARTSIARRLRLAREVALPLKIADANPNGISLAAVEPEPACWNSTA
jgi:hypothetical protein